MRIRLEKNTLLIKILLAFIAVNFLSEGMTLVFILLVILLAADHFRLYIGKGVVSFYSLCGFSIFAFCIGLIYGKWPVSVLLFPVAYYIGLRMKANDEKDIEELVFLFAYCMAFHIILNIFYELQIFGLDVFKKAVHYDIWSKSVSSATGIMCNATILAALVFPLFFIKNSKKVKIMGFAMLLLIFAYDLSLGGRSFLVCCILSLLVGVVTISVICKGTGFSLNKAVKTVLFSILLVVIAWILYVFNRDKINDFIRNSYFYHRFFRPDADQVLFKSSRTAIKWYYLTHMLEYPWGGNQIRANINFYAHELWLDIYDTYGIIPYILIIQYTLLSVYRAISVVRNRYLSTQFRVTMTCVYMVLLVQFWLEPVLEGAPLLVFFYCMLDGVITNYASNCFFKSKRIRGVK